MQTLLYYIESIFTRTPQLRLTRATWCSTFHEVYVPFSVCHLKQQLSLTENAFQSFASLGFLNLLMPLSALSSAVLFHTASAPATTLQGFIPLLLPYAVSSTFFPLDVSTSSGLYSPATPVSHLRHFKPKTSTWPSWALFLQGFDFLCLFRPSTKIPSCSLPFTQKWLKGPTSRFCSTENLLSLFRDKAALLKFLAFQPIIPVQTLKKI